MPSRAAKCKVGTGWIRDGTYDFTGDAITAFRALDPDTHTDVRDVLREAKADRIPPVKPPTASSFRHRSSNRSCGRCSRGAMPSGGSWLCSRCQTELFRPADVPKGSISVNVNDGVVELRGELADQGQIDELGNTARKIDGVKDVRNLLSTNSG